MNPVLKEIICATLSFVCLSSTALADPTLLSQAESAITEGDVAALNKVLDQGLDANSNIESGEPLLIFAVGQALFDPLSSEPDKEIPIIRSLVQHHANPNASLSGKNYFSNALIEAISGVNPGVVQALMDAGADTNSLFCAEKSFKAWAFDSKSFHHGTALDFARSAEIHEGPQTRFGFAEVPNGQKILGILQSRGAHPNDGLDLSSCQDPIRKVAQIGLEK